MVRGGRSWSMGGDWRRLGAPQTRLADRQLDRRRIGETKTRR